MKTDSRSITQEQPTTEAKRADLATHALNLSAVARMIGRVRLEDATPEEQEAIDRATADIARASLVLRNCFGETPKTVPSAVRKAGAR
jgi:hypothetical protein